jgi:hypothetical protein
MSGGTEYILAGYVLLAAWSALPRFSNPFATFFARLLVSLGIPAAIFMTLPKVDLHSVMFAGTLYLMIMALPILMGAYLLAGLRSTIGPLPYIGLLIVATAAFILAYNRYLKS